MIITRYNKIMSKSAQEQVAHAECTNKSFLKNKRKFWNINKSINVISKEKLVK